MNHYLSKIIFNFDERVFNDENTIETNSKTSEAETGV